MTLPKIITFYACLFFFSLPLVVMGKNNVPAYVTCAGPNGEDAISYTRDEINFAVAKGKKHFQMNTVAGRGVGPDGKMKMGYPHRYHVDHMTPPNLGTANRNTLMLFPMFKNSKEYKSGPPHATRVLFDVSGDFAAVLTHTGLANNDLRACWETDKHGKPKTTMGVPFSSPDPPSNFQRLPRQCFNCRYTSLSSRVTQILLHPFSSLLSTRDATPPSPTETMASSGTSLAHTTNPRNPSSPRTATITTLLPSPSKRTGHGCPSSCDCHSTSPGTIASSSWYSWLCMDRLKWESFMNKTNLVCNSTSEFVEAVSPPVKNVAALFPEMMSVYEGYAGLTSLFKGKPADAAEETKAAKA